jgi:RNA polymerase sigma-70 factor (ECF subfamily)
VTLTLAQASNDEWRGGPATARTDPSVASLDARAAESPVLDEMIAAHQRRVFRVAFRLLGDIDEAGSATQDCFLRAYRAMDRCPGDEEGRRRWLIRLVVNLSIDRLRSRKWKWWQSREAPLDRDGESPRSPEREALAAELRTRLMQALNGLPARQRAVFVLRHYEDYPLGRIAQELGLSEGTVKSHLSRALGKLREDLKDFYGTSAS